MGECERCGRPAYLTEVYTEHGRRIGGYGRDCAHIVVRELDKIGAAAYRKGGRRIWVRPGRSRAQGHA